jgi:segregation and condensation protein B
LSDDASAPPSDFSDDETTNTFSDNEPTHSAGRPPIEGELPGDLPPEELDQAFDASDHAAGPLSSPVLDESHDDQLAEELPPLSPEGPTPGAELTPEAAEVAARLESILESLLFAADKPLTLKQLGDLVGERDLLKVRESVTVIEGHYQPRGVQLHQVAGGYQFRTSPENATWVQKLLQQKPVRLSRALLETLAIVSYRQPITRPEIDEIRGVDSGGTLKTLMDRALVRILGKKEEPGRPMLYGTTREFLEFFNLKDLKDLPTLREFHELTEEHRAQVEALESAAPEGSVETEEEARAAAAAATRPLERVELKAPPEDAEELEEIDRLIATAGANLPEGDPTARPPAPPENDSEAEG